METSAALPAYKTIQMSTKSVYLFNPEIPEDHLLIMTVMLLE